MEIQFQTNELWLVTTRVTNLAMRLKITSSVNRLGLKLLLKAIEQSYRQILIQQDFKKVDNWAICPTFSYAQYLWLGCSV